MKNIYWERFKIAFGKPFKKFLFGFLYIILGLFQILLFPLLALTFIVSFILFGIADGIDNILVAPTYFVITGKEAHSYDKNVYRKPSKFFDDCLNRFGDWAVECPFCIYGKLFDLEL